MREKTREKLSGRIRSLLSGFPVLRMLLILVVSVHFSNFIQAQEVTVKWIKVAGPGEAIFEDPADPQTKVKFTQPGTYVLRMIVTSGDEESTDDVEVVVKPEPEVVPPPASDIINWPIEVLGPDGTTETVRFNLANASGAVKSWFKIHNLTYDNKVSISLNGGAWVNIANANVDVRKMDHIAGGIGGGHSTIAFNMAMLPGGLKQGANEIKFRFNSRSGERSSGFRVLRFNFLRQDGSRIIPENAFVENKPETWQPILTSQADINEGSRLWHSANLTHPAFPAGHIIRAKCADCHTESGRDLKYFNYSNRSIVTRSQFHGLTEKQGQQIASYIRTLNVPASVNGRPWNPPYQPAPGMDARPLSEWAAGAGEEAVLGSFEEIYNYLFPEAVEADGSVNPAKVTGASLSVDKPFNMREMPIPFQLPDWNAWLPGIHPMDSTGDYFLNHQGHKYYQTLKSMAPRTASHDTWFLFQNAMTYYTKLDSWPTGFPGGPSSNLSAPERHSMETYDAALWAMTKAWEVMQDKDLESYSGEYFKRISPIAEDRSWFTNMPFFTSPNMLGLPHENHGIRNGSKVTRFYFAYIWYHLQGVLYSGQGIGVPISPVDWGYTYGFLSNMQMPGNGLDLSRYPFTTSPLFFAWVYKAVQLANNGRPPNTADSRGPRIDWASPMRMMGLPGLEHKYYTHFELYKKSLEVLTHDWLDMVQKWTPDQWQQDLRVTSSVGFHYPADKNTLWQFFFSMNTVKELFYMSSRFRDFGIPASMNARMKQVFQPIYRSPGIPWDQF